MIRNKLIGTLTTTILLIVVLLSVHMYENVKELYLHKKMAWMHQEYTTILNIKYAVNVQINEAFNHLVFARDPDLGEYKKARKQVELAFKNLFDSIAEQEHSAESKHEEEWEKDESSKTFVLKEKYLEIDDRLESIVRLTQSQEKAVTVINQQLREVDAIFDQFVVMAERWIQHEKEEIAEVEGNFNLLTHKNSIILTIGTIVTILFSISMAFSVFHTINTRLNELVRGTERVAHGNLEEPIELKGKDELTYLSREFNSMMERLQVSQKRLLEQSYYSGMSEMVSGILHNVKNSFSPFIVDTEVAKRQVRSVKLDDIGVVLEEFKTEGISPERRKDLLDLADLILGNSREVLDKISGKLGEMQERAYLIEQIMEDQSRFVKADRFREKVVLQELVYDALTLIKKDFLSKVAVVVDPSVAEVGEFVTQKIILMQIISNVIVNAVESVLRSEVKYGIVQVKGKVERVDDSEIIHLRVIDNGEGIEKDNLQKIFQRGVSSKAKRSGLGLHWCANSIAALQGRIFAESDGPGKGACFHLFFTREIVEEAEG